MSEQTLRQGKTKAFEETVFFLRSPLLILHRMTCDWKCHVRWRMVSRCWRQI